MHIARERNKIKFIEYEKNRDQLLYPHLLLKIYFLTFVGFQLFMLDFLGLIP